jgi:transposase-like protein
MDMQCPHCGSAQLDHREQRQQNQTSRYLHCRECGYQSLVASVEQRSGAGVVRAHSQVARGPLGSRVSSSSRSRS